MVQIKPKAKGKRTKAPSDTSTRRSQSRWKSINSNDYSDDATLVVSKRSDKTVYVVLSPNREIKFRFSVKNTERQPSTPGWGERIDRQESPEVRRLRAGRPQQVA